jgi:membrane associated rhomboid family serine protease
MKFIPKIVKWLIGINIGVYILTLSLIHSYDFNLIEHLALRAGHDFRWYQLITHAFTHSTHMSHLIGNMTFFMIFAIFVQKRIGPTTCLLLYVYTAIISGLFWLGGHTGGGLVGASGTLFGFMTVFLFVPVEKWFFKALKILVIFTILQNIFKFLLLPFGFSHVAYDAHIGGVIAGIIWVATSYAFKFLKPWKKLRIYLKERL